MSIMKNIKLETVIKAANESHSYCELLTKIGIKPVGGNYKTIKNYISLNKIDISHFTRNLQKVKYSNVLRDMTVDDVIKAVTNSKSYADVLRNLDVNPNSGNNYSIIKKIITENKIDISSFTHSVWNKDRKIGPNYKNRIPLKEILIENSTYTNTSNIRYRLLEAGLKRHICEKCNLHEWMGSPIPLELHHVNGINLDNRLQNLQLLCPNCHALTDNYRGRNIKLSIHDESHV